MFSSNVSMSSEQLLQQQQNAHCAEAVATKLESLLKQG